MPASRTSKNPRHPLRTAFRWCSIAALLSFILLVAVFLWANIFGLPGFLGAAIKNELRRHGLEADFSRLRLRGLSHVIARNVRIQGADNTNAPTFAVREAEFLIDYGKLGEGELNVSGLRLTSGTLLVPSGEGNGRSLAVTNINANVLLLPDETLRVVDFSAETLGGRARVSGELRHFSKLKFPSEVQSGGGSTWQKHLRDVLDISEQLRFTERPEISISLVADGADLPGARASVTIRSGEASSQWGTFDRLEITSAIAPASSNQAVRANFQSEITGFRTQFGLVDSLRLNGETRWTRDMERLLTNYVHVATGAVDSKWFRFSNAEAILASSQETTNSPIHTIFSLNTGLVESSGLRAGTNALHASLAHPLPFPTPAAWLGRLVSPVAQDRPESARNNTVSGNWHLHSADVAAGNAVMDTVQLRGSVLTTTNRAGEASPGFWRVVAPVQAPWEMVVTNIRSGEIEIGSMMANGNWQFPELTITSLDAQPHGGHLKANGKLDVVSRKVSASADAKFSYERISVLLEKPVQRWLAQFTWQEPPAVQADFSLTLPPWTNLTARFKNEVLPTLYITGKFDGGGTFRGIPADHAKSSFVFSNYVWRLPDLLVTRPEGQARIDYMGHVAKADFHCKVESGIDPAILKPLFPEDQHRAFNMVKFAQPPLIHAEAWGNWIDDSRLGVIGSIAATNFFIKEQAFTDIAGNFQITNSLIHCSNVVAHRGKEEARAPYLRIDLPGEVMFVTNIVSTIDPYIAMSLVGDEAYEAIDPYRFAVTPTVRVNGIVPLRHWNKADLRFEVAGNEFSFWKFHLPSLVGEVHWRANHIMFSNVVANFYGGKARWSGHFIVDPRQGEDYANFSFYAQTTNTELKYLVADLTGRTNHMEGILSGELVITSANTKNDRTWNGFGHANLEDGFLWNVPIFGVFSPILDGIAPGLGGSRISSGSGTFNVTNSVIHTSDMQVRAAAFRLAYKGQVDLDGNLDANVEALILRDAWVLGKLFSIALWPVSKAFEARISGTLDAPKTDLRYVPKFLLAPFRALNTLANPPQNKSPSSNNLQEQDAQPSPARKTTP